MPRIRENRIPFANIDFIDAVLRDMPKKGFSASMTQVTKHLENHIRRNNRPFSFRDLYIFMEGSRTYLDLPLTGNRNVVDHELELRLRPLAQLRLK